MNKVALYVAFAFMLTATSCKKYLEKEPDNRAKLTSPEKVSQLLGTAYPSANYMAFAEAMSDNANDKGAGVIKNVNEDSYFFRDVRDNAQDTPEFYWFGCYEAIAAANQALQACNQAPDPENYKAQKGEALLARAYAHFMLVTFFSKVYDPSTAATDPGIPYVLEPETVVIKQYERKTVAYVYEMIEKDLLEGLPLIDDKSYTVPRYHFNRAAANAFATRFYLFKKEYSKVIQYANTAVPNYLASLRPWNTTYANLGLNDVPQVYLKSSEPANLLLIGTTSWYANGYEYARYRYGMDASVQAQVLPTSVPVSGGTWGFRTGTVGTGNIAVTKLSQHFAYESPTSNFGRGYVMIPAFTVEEVLFNKAEASAYTGQFTPAIADLNMYLSTRLVSVTPGALPANRTLTEDKLATYSGTNSIRDGLLKLVLNYKRAEFVQEGMRWFDILRHNIPVVHTTKTGETHTLAANDPRRLLQIPQSALLSGVAQNPR
ncbi:RagB/SusD family nutrient uptake outer membrane protein [Segetibacter sp. 3557_3]|uniref:RagB/SusD family nutrient uptake outer membrane protein n=1 Tax=Segetibacter sp. 3557_3 TaxID=2547429 RepID=UPI001058B875|nr:RagB/SusD family nutrient uptake outer membrane protein [Segetibacter sp. 3557_3]TDH26831.1 RagB/SusD family nutrient uptake outer membrane protein [Segetibacter sp. 3557_3]